MDRCNVKGIRAAVSSRDLVEAVRESVGIAEPLTTKHEQRMTNNAIGELKDLELRAGLQIKLLPYLFGDHNLGLR